MSRNRCISLVAALFALGLGGCCHTETFTSLEQSFVPAERRSRPAVFLDRLPKRDYRTVGVIEVARSDSTPLGEFIDGARAHAEGIGCDVVIDSFILGQARGYCRDTPVYGAPNCCTRKFLCGVYTAEDVAWHTLAGSGPATGNP